jgi:hypothetical protein
VFVAVDYLLIFVKVQKIINLEQFYAIYRLIKEIFLFYGFVGFLFFNLRWVLLSLFSLWWDKAFAFLNVRFRKSSFVVSFSRN